MSTAVRRARGRRMIVSVAVLALVVAAGLAVWRHLDGAGPNAQQAVVTQWAQAVLDGNQPATDRLSCPSQRDAGELLVVSTTDVTSVRAYDVQSTGPHEWSVRLQLSGPGTNTSYTIAVDQRGSRYLVCGF